MKEYTLIEKKLDKIIELLERNSIWQAKNEMVNGEYVVCTCHEKGQTSAVVTCPVHG